VLVPALVTTRKGEPVFALTAKDFALTDDGVTQPLTLEPDNDGQPLALIVAIETGGDGARQLRNYGTLPLMIDNLTGQVPHKVAIVTFDSAPKLVQDFTDNSDDIASALRNLLPGDQGAAILDTLGFSVDLLKRQPIQYRRAILLLSETLDRPAPGSHVSMEEALREIGDTNTAIYSLAFSSIKSESWRRSGNAFQTSAPGPRHGCMARPDGPNPPTVDEADAGAKDTVADSAPARTPGQVANQAFDCAALLAPPLALGKMAVLAGVHSLERNVPETVAEMTGGEYFPFKDTRSLERDLETISNHVPNRYMLSFQPLSPHVGLHTVKLHLNGYPELDLAARNSYWVDSEATPQSR
jgi:VWFA-related protein